jgi:hypothetical protein
MSGEDFLLIVGFLAFSRDASSQAASPLLQTPGLIFAGRTGTSQQPQ